MYLVECTVEPHLWDTLVMGTLFGRPVYIISIHFDLSIRGTLLMGTKSSSPGGVPISEVPLYEELNLDYCCS